MLKKVKIYRVVLDANIFVRSILSPKGLGAKIVDLWKQTKYVLLLSYDLLDEIADVLLRQKLMQKYNYSYADVESLITLCKKQAIVIKPALIIQICRDPDDDKIINCAIVGRSHYLVSGDADLYDDNDVKRILFEYGVQVMKPENFIEIFKEEDFS